jgi:hypothetical protein
VQPLAVVFMSDGVVAVLNDIKAKKHLLVSMHHIAFPRRYLLSRTIGHRLPITTLLRDIPHLNMRLCTYSAVHRRHWDRRQHPSLDHPCDSNRQSYQTRRPSSPGWGRSKR